MKRVTILAALAVALAVGACSHSPPPRLPGPRPRAPFHPPVEQLLRYDTNKDGEITLAEFSAGIRADFMAADTNHDGVLDLDEMRAVNAARWAADASTATPLIDWNQDGHIDFNEFAAGPRALFGQLDRNGDGVLSGNEVRIPRPQGARDGDDRGEHRGPPPQQ